MNNVDIQVKKAILSDIDSMKKLWKECFFDEDNYINFFYDNGFFKSNTYIIKDKEEIISMASIFDVNYVYYEKNYRGYYVYAVATSNKHRNKGLMKKLMSHIENLSLQNKIDFLILVPQNEELFLMYEKLGYKNFSKIYKLKVDKLSFDNFYNFKEVSIKEYFEFREKFLKQCKNYITFIGSSYEYLKQESSLTYNKTAYINYDNKNIYFMYSFEDNKIYIKEVLSECVDKVFLSNICSLFKNKEVNLKSNYLSLPLSINCFTNYTMLKSFNEKIEFNNDVYVNLMLD